MDFRAHIVDLAAVLCGGWTLRPSQTPLGGNFSPIKEGPDRRRDWITTSKAHHPRLLFREASRGWRAYAHHDRDDCRGVNIEGRRYYLKDPRDCLPRPSSTLATRPIYDEAMMKFLFGNFLGLQTYIGYASHQLLSLAEPDPLVRVQGFPPTF